MMKLTIVDNKFLKVLVVNQRAKQIRNGALPRFQTPIKRATRIAFEEFDRGLIGFEFMGISHLPKVLKV